MNCVFYTQHQLRVFFEDLKNVFIKYGFELVEEPYIDYALCGFRATFMRHYTLCQPTPLYDGILDTVIHVVALPFGHGQKMVIMTSPRSLENELISDTIKLRIHFDKNGTPNVVHGDQKHKCVPMPDTYSVDDEDIGIFVNDWNMTFIKRKSKVEREIATPTRRVDRDQNGSDCKEQFMQDLAKYVLKIIETISPGLIKLPFELKLEILKKLSIDSILKMSQVNNEFRTLIFKYGESLWRHLCYRDFNIKSINRLIYRTWLELYRDAYIMHQIEIRRKERALPGVPERPALPPAPNLLQIEWLPEVLELPFYPMNEPFQHEENMRLALEFHPIREANSLDSLI